MRICAGSSASSITRIGLAVGSIIVRRYRRCETLRRFQGPDIYEVSTDDISFVISIHFRRVFVVVQYTVILFQCMLYGFISNSPEWTKPTHAETGFVR
jgi:hypothetical protein